MAVLLCAMLDAPAAGPLQLRPGMGGMADPGAISCGTLTRILPKGPTGFRHAVLTWAEGYIYGKSGQTMDEVLAAQPAGGPDWNFDTLTDHMVDYCAAHPDAPLPAAAEDLWARLRPASP
jgi:hypothetical protein